MEKKKNPTSSALPDTTKTKCRKFFQPNVEVGRILRKIEHHPVNTQTLFRAASGNVSATVYYCTREGLRIRGLLPLSFPSSQLSIKRNREDNEAAISIVKQEGKKHKNDSSDVIDLTSDE